MSIAVRNLKRELLPAVEALMDPAVTAKMRQAQHTVLNRASTAQLCSFLEENAQ